MSDEFSDVIGSFLTEREADAHVKDEDVRRQTIRDEALEWLKQWEPNRDELPAGIQGNSEGCVFANAMGGSWTGADWAVPEDRIAYILGYEHIQPPSVVAEFIQRFDAGEYPDLILGGAREGDEGDA